MDGSALLKRIRIDESTGCWNWTGAKSHFGYGKVNLKGLFINAHRLAAHIWMGFDLDDSRCVLHHCDNPPCVNPDHLFFGTKKDNVRDCVRKGRFRGGIRKSERTSCIKGHPYIPGTSYFFIEPNGRRYRRCRICERESAKRYYYACKARTSGNI